jgi:hypothetical protein
VLPSEERFHLATEANSLRRIAGKDHLRRPARLVATATCAKHAEEVLAGSFSLREGARTLRAPIRRFNIELNTLLLQTRDGARTVCKKLLADQSQGERGTTIVFCSNVRAATSLLGKLRKGSQLGGDSYDVMHSKLTFAEKGAVLERLMSGGLRALVGTSILQMGIDKPGVLRVLFSQLPLSLEELYQAMGRAGRGTTLMATVELVFDVKCITGCLALIAGDPVGLANFIGVLELVVDYFHCKHSFLSEALGDQQCITRALPREGCCSACSAAHFLDRDFVSVDATARIIALCAVVESHSLLQGMAPTVTRLLEAGPQVRATDWTGGEKNWTEKKTRAFLIFSLIGLRHLRVLRFAPADAGPATESNSSFPSVPVAVNSTTLDSLVRSRRPIMILFPKSLAPRYKFQRL